MDSCERGMNPVAKIIINPWKEYMPNPGSNQLPCGRRTFEKHCRKRRKCPHSLQSFQKLSSTESLKHATVGKEISVIHYNGSQLFPFFGYGSKSSRRKYWLLALSPFFLLCFQKVYFLFLTLSQTTNFRLFQIERVCRQ